MELLIGSFLAGILTVAAPCILPFLPVIVGGSVLRSQQNGQPPSLKSPLVIATSLALSIIAFTLLLKFTTLAFGIPVAAWNVIAGGIVALFGLNLLFPSAWEWLMLRLNLQSKTALLMQKSQSSHGVKKDILLGASLGPIFNSCSPTYALIVAITLPASFLTGLSYLVAYALGVALILLLLGVFGSAMVHKLRWLSNPHGIFKKAIGVLFVVVGLAVMVGLDKKAQTYVLENGWYDPIMKVEEQFR